MNKIETGIPGLFVLEPQTFEDDRGFFFESYNQEKLKEISIDTEFIQDNHSFSRAGVLRGLHYQRSPRGQVKLVRCLRGRLWDVAVDVRAGSETYGTWFGVELSAENKKQLYIPGGFLHGFLALEDCEMMYKVSDYWSPDHEGSVRYDDADIAIEWPALNVDLILSSKDAEAPKWNGLKL